MEDLFHQLLPEPKKRSPMGTCVSCNASVRICEIVEYNGKCEDCSVCPDVKRQDLPKGLTVTEEEILREYDLREREKRKNSKPKEGLRRGNIRIVPNGKASKARQGMYHKEQGG